MTTPTFRKAEAPVHDQFLERWSPRALRPDALTAVQVASLFEAARWAPSCFNDQPWVFVYGTNPEDRERIAGLLVDANKVWAVKAPLLGVVFARKTFGRNGKPNRWAQFDSGSASMSLMLQAHAMGLAAHFMGGFDEAASYEVLGVPADEYDAMAAFVVGHRGDASELPEDYAAREVPSDRKPHADVAHQGRLTTTR